jgi:hypothetical protein
MNYLEWNNAIAKHLFNEANAGKDVYLYATKRDIIRLGRETNRFEQATDDTSIWQDFVKAINNVSFTLRDGTPVNRLNYTSLIDRLKSVYAYNCKQLFKGQSVYPLYLSFLVVLVLPLADIADNDFPRNSKDYYPRANDYFQTNGINNDNLTTARYKTICVDDRNRNSDDIWLSLENWSQTHNWGLFIKPNIQGNTVNRYVRTVFTQALISESDVSRIKFLFDAIDLPVGMNLSDDEIEKLLKKDKTQQIVFRGNVNRYNSAMNNILPHFINLFKKEYEKWDGTTYIENIDKTTGKTTVEDAGTTYNIYLTLRFRNNEVQFKHRIWHKNPTESPETLCFNRKETYLRTDGWSDAEYEVSDICHQVKMIDSKNNIKAIFKPSDIYLFQEISQNVWASKSKYEKGIDYYVLVKENHQTVNWLTNNARQQINYKLPDSYLLFRITEANYSCDECRLLTLPIFKNDEIEINDSDNNIVISSGRNKTVFSNSYPIYFEISGISKDCTVFAEFDELGRNKAELKYDSIGNLWVLQDKLNNLLCQDKEFSIRIYLNNECVFESTRKYEYSKPALINIQSSFRDQYGNYVKNGETAISKGLELLPKEASARDQNLAATQQQTITKGRYNEQQDELLYAITAIGKMKKKQFRESVNIIINRCFQDDNDIQKHRFDILNEYDRLGYVNYDYYNKEGIVTVNEPAIIRLPVRYERIVNKITSITPLDFYFRAILVGARTKELVEQLEQYCQSNNVRIEYQSVKDELSYGIVEQGVLIRTEYKFVNENKLLPQQIVLYAKSLDNIEAVANCLKKKFCCIFQKEKVFAEILFKNIPSIEDYKNTVINSENEIFDYPFEASGYKNFKCLDFREDLSDKDTFDPQLDLVTYSPGTYKEQTILWYKRKQYPIDKYWGYFVLMSLMNVVGKHILIDEDNFIIKIPVQLRFPKIFARAFALMSEERPYSKIGNVLYRCYKLPVIAPYNIAISIPEIREKLNINILNN